MSNTHISGYLVRYLLGRKTPRSFIKSDAGQSAGGEEPSAGGFVVHNPAITIVPKNTTHSAKVVETSSVKSWECQPRGRKS